jgi:hypothetical protein
MSRRNSLIPAIQKWAISITRDPQVSSNTWSKRLSLDNSMGLPKDEPTASYSDNNDNSDSNNLTLTTRRQSLDVNVERAVAMVNEHPELCDDDGALCPFGTRRDSLFL